MKRLTAQSMVIALVFFGLISFLLPSQSFAHEQDWTYIQSIGGMKLKAPKQTEVEWTLPVDVDVTGKRAITVRPTSTSEYLMCEGIRAEFHGNKIYLALFTGVPVIGQTTGACPAISLGHPDPGMYTVFYNGLNEEPVKMGQIVITP